jgi:hypothetical protein
MSSKKSIVKPPSYIDQFRKLNKRTIGLIVTVVLIAIAVTVAIVLAAIGLHEAEESEDTSNKLKSRVNSLESDVSAMLSEISALTTQVSILTGQVTQLLSVTSSCNSGQCLDKQFFDNWGNCLINQTNINTELVYYGESQGFITPGSFVEFFRVVNETFFLINEQISQQTGISGFVPQFPLTPVFAYMELFNGTTDVPGPGKYCGIINEPLTKHLSSIRRPQT